MIEIDRITKEAQLKELWEAGAKDGGHQILYPNFLVKKHNEIVGCLSLDIMPVIYAWMHTEKVNARDSVEAMKFAERKMQDMGQKSGVIVCREDSPYYPVLPRWGYTEVINKMTLNIKNYVQ